MKNRDLRLGENILIACLLTTISILLQYLCKSLKAIQLLRSYLD